MTTDTTDSREARFQLHKLLVEYGSAIASPRWMWAADRWHELVFALLVQVTGVPEREVRDAVGELARLGMLDLPTLAEVAAADPVDTQSPVWRHATGILREHGWDEPDADRGIAAVCRAACAVHTRHGSLQRYLRRSAEAMLAELDALLTVTGLPVLERRTAITCWLQNALNLPVSLVDDSMMKFCDAHGITPEQLISAAQDIGLDLSMIDDLTQCWMHARKPATHAQ